MEKKRYDDAKKEIRSVLLTYQSCISLQEFLKTYKNILGEKLPSKALGFPSDVQFLQSMPDVVNVYTDPYGKVSLTGIADESSEHIQKLVRKQRKSHPKGSKSNNFQRQSQTNHLSSSHLFSNPNKSPVNKELTFLPGTLRAEIIKVMDMYRNGVTFSNFAVAYHRRFNKCLPLLRGLDSLEDMISLIPELEIRSINNEKFICFTNNDVHNQLGASVATKNISFQEHTKDKECKRILTDCTSNIHKSGITEDVIQNFKLVLKKCPDGIKDMYLPSLYEHLTKKRFDLHELGYTSILELVDELPHIFKRVSNSEKGNNWVILPADAEMKHFSYERNSKKSPVGIPSDAASPSLQFINPTIPQNLNLSEHIPVYISAINNPSLFWFQLQLENTIKEFKEFEKDMGYFYDNLAGPKYIMHDSDISIGSTCIVCCPEDNNWCRAVIKSIPSIKLVNVFFVDYGSRENIPRNNVYYVRNKYHDYPTQAFKAYLAGLKPAKNATTWDVKAQQRFIQLCKCTYLMAYLNPVDKETFSAYLCDTSGDSGVDIHINDTLMKEGFAELCFENQFDENCLQSDYKVSTSNGINSDRDSYFSSESSEHNQYVAPEESCSTSEAEMSELSNDKQKKIVFSPKDQVDRFKSNIHHTEEQVQESKRFVKQVHLCEEYNIHVINLGKKLFMTCGELSRLLWKEKDSSFLIERLKYKEVDIPFHKLSKESYVPLFQQCIYYKIPEYEKLNPSSSSLILYSLENAFDILNVFGHPSICLRLAIKNEILSFDPSDSMWNEFSYNELTDLSDIEKSIEEQLNKLCLYDLKAKKEALDIKRKILLIKNDSTTEEIKTINYIQSAIERRMKKIETICSQYSSCS